MFAQFDRGRSMKEIAKLHKCTCIPHSCALVSDKKNKFVIVEEIDHKSEIVEEIEIDLNWCWCTRIITITYILQSYDALC